MTTYYAITILDKGRRRTEIIKANSKIVAIKLARKRFPTSLILNISESDRPMEDFFSQLLLKFQAMFNQEINIYDKISTTRQIAVMTDAGMPIHDTLDDVSENTHNKQLREIYAQISHDINAGKSMSESMKAYSNEFGHVAIAMTQLGERTGQLSSAYNTLADILENLRDNREKFKKAIRSPLITFSAMIIAFIVLIVVVVPKFKELFSRFKTDLPLPTQMLLKLEWAFSNYGLIIIILLVVMIIWIKYLYKSNQNFQLQIDRLLIHPKFYLINKAIFLSTMHQYSLVLAELIKSGIPVSEALDTSVGMVHNLEIKEQLLTVNRNLDRGISLSEALDMTGLYENMLLQMIKAGESSGQLDKMLDKVRDYYYMKFQNFIDNLSAYIEPIMLFFIAGLVLLMALGIFMPMWDLGNVIK